MSRLLSINNYHYRRGGSDVVYFEHAQLLERAGWRNAFFSMHHPSNDPSPWSKFFVDEIEFGRKYSAIQAVARASKVIYSHEARGKLKKLLREFRPDIAHLHCIYHHLSPSFISILKDEGIPVVMTAHDLKIACPAYKMLNRGGVCEKCSAGNVINVALNRCIRNSVAASALVALETAVHRLFGLYEQIDKIVVPSRFFLEKFVEWGWPREKFVYIPNCVSTAEFEPSYQPGSYFLYFGRLAPEKGVATLLGAAAKANVNLIVVGTGPEDALLREMAAELGGRVEFLGYRSGEPLREVIRGARAVVLPSEWYENAPMSILEAFGLGKPVVGANIGGIPEMVQQESTGWRFESGDVAGLADVLGEVAAMSDDSVAEFGRRARWLVEERFNQEAYMKSTLDLYSSIRA